jgi:hypothetical protein
MVIRKGWQFLYLETGTNSGDPEGMAVPVT